MRFYKFVIGLIAFCSFAAEAQISLYQNIKLETFPDHKPVTLAFLSDKPIYLKFWATWCQPCMQQMPHFQKIAQEYGDKINIVAVNININEEDNQIQDVVKKFGLTMPVWLDNAGELGVALGLIGTPHSVLMSKNGKVLYSTHNADDELDKRLSMLASNEMPPLQSVEIPSAADTKELLKPWQTGEHYLFFTATWCDWYLAESRPAMAQRCAGAQAEFGKIYEQLKDKPWTGIVNHLWTDDDAVDKFEKLYKMPINFKIDTLGVLFNHFNVRDIPTLLRIKDGAVVSRITNFDSIDEVVKQLKIKGE